MAGRAGVLAVLLAVCCALAKGAAGQCTVWGSSSSPKWGRKCAFPWESCATNSLTGRYTLAPTSYSKDAKTGLWTQCVTVVVMDRDTCLQRAGFPKNSTRCCDTIFRKLKINAAPGCWGSMNSYTVNSGPSLTSFTWEKAGNKSLVVKLTPLNFTPETADGAVICFTLRPPCDTLSKLSGGGPLEYAMYDKKVATTFNGKKSKPYECCPTGFFSVAAGK